MSTNMELIFHDFSNFYLIDMLMTSHHETVSYLISFYFRYSSFRVIFLGNTASKLSKYGVISGPYFPVFGLSTKIYPVNLRIQSEYRKVRSRNNSVFRHFSRSAMHRKAMTTGCWCFVILLI